MRERDFRKVCQVAEFGHKFVFSLTPARTVLATDAIEFDAVFGCKSKQIGSIAFEAYLTAKK